MDKLFDLLPDSLKDILDSVPDNINLKQRYSVVLKGYESFGFDDQIINYKFYLEDVLQDLMACSRCKGECNTNAGKNGIKYFFDIDHDGIMFNHGKVLCFKLFECPGTIERQNQIKAQITSGILREPPKELNQTISENFRRFKESLKQGGKVIPFPVKSEGDTSCQP